MARIAVPPSESMAARQSGNPRLQLFYGLAALLLLVLVGGLVWRQLLQPDLYSGRERTQSERRLLVPGPRGSIFDREGRLLVGNRARFAVTLALDELHDDFRQEYQLVRKNFRNAADSGRPADISVAQLEQIARTTVVQRYLDQTNAILGRHETLDQAAFNRHYSQQQPVPFSLVSDLTPEESARLTEQLPVGSPLQVYALSARYYPSGPAAAHTLGYVGLDPDARVEELPGDDLTTFNLKGSAGRDGLEKKFDAQLQGQWGGTIFRVTPAGYRVNPPLEKISPVAGQNITTSLDLDVQLVAEEALGDMTGAAVVVDVRTGEVLALASKPGYNLADFSPRLSQATSADIENRHAWSNRAMASFYPPGSTFKIITSIAALRSGAITPDQLMEVACEGTYTISAGQIKRCDNGLGHHGALTLSEGIAESCDVYFYQVGLLTGADTIAAEARSFHLDRRTGIELPYEPDGALIPDAAWKKQHVQRGAWFPGDTANMAIGQGDVLVSPLNMACFAASFARDEVFTQPTLLHNPTAPAQHSERTGLTPAQRAAILEGMENCIYGPKGTARSINQPGMKIPGLRIAGKTGTAQFGNPSARKDIAWFICFAPLDAPRVAVAVAIESDELGAGESLQGGQAAAPVANEILKAWWSKQPKLPALAPF